ncbi:MAG TPA: recombinase RecT [Thermoanaerobaculia bacterium]|jgi:recombination protein RecT|nr:recombinase RecT [Thermoanaerobaculia bacterium]
MDLLHSDGKPKRHKKAKPAQKEVKPFEEVRHELELMRPRIALALPEHLTADRLLRSVLTALQGSPALLECDRASLYRAVMTCALLGLEPDGALGQAWLVPSRGKVQLVPGYWGFIALARDSGQIVSINAQAVHRYDHFDYAYGLSERLEHVPASGNRGDITHFYAYAKLKDGGHHFDVMSRAEVDAVRDRSESYQAYRAGKAEDSAWVTAYAEMGKTAVLRRLARYLPLNVQKAAALADLHEAGQHAALDDLGEIVVDFPQTEMEMESAPAVGPRAPRSPQPVPERRQEERLPEAIDLTEEEFAGLLPPVHIVHILDAMSERDMPEEVLAEIVGVPLEEVLPEDEAAILRTIASWQP